jgi:phage shock protein PspC (stress-responsive transcriptional regulator)
MRFWHGACIVRARGFLPTELDMTATDNQTVLPLRSHTILGVCEAIGEDFGFNPTYLRVPFAAVVLYSPIVAALAYLALGVVVLASRVVFPRAKVTDVQAAEAHPAEASPEELKLAA